MSDVPARRSSACSDERRRDLKSYFGSVEATLEHLLYVDRLWLQRFRASGHEFPALEEADLVYEIQSGSKVATKGFAELTSARIETDQLILAWIEDLDDAILAAPLRYTTTNNEPREHALWLAVSQMFNHQAHHRGEVTALLEQLGHAPERTDFLDFALE